jgi:hypothetical protein
MSDSQDPKADDVPIDVNAEDDGGYSSDEGYSSLASRPMAPAVVFSDYIAYDRPIMWLLLLAPAATLGCVLLVALGTDKPPAERDLELKILCWTTVGIIVLYIFILPYRIYVYSDATVGVRVIPLTYNFGDVVRAFVSPGMFDCAYRPRFKFATNLDNRVVVMRRKGWDVTVSPCNPQEFVDALDSVVKALEGKKGKKRVIAPTEQFSDILA